MRSRFYKVGWPSAEQSHGSRVFRVFRSKNEKHETQKKMKFHAVPEPACLELAEGSKGPQALSAK